MTGIPAFFQPSGTSCVKATYSAKGNKIARESKTRLSFKKKIPVFSDDGTVGVRNTATKPDGETFQEICGYADVPDPSKPGELQVHFPFSPAGDYWVIDTDYESFTSIYACQDVLGLFKIEFAWILVRDLTNVPEESMKRAMEAFTSNGLATDAFEDVVQEGCTYVDPSGAEPCVP